MPNYLKPHSDEWFKQLEKRNPQHAAEIHQLVTLAGNVEICSICGEEGAQDYKLQSSQDILCSVTTLKLCEDCLNTRKDEFVPFINRNT